MTDNLPPQLTLSQLQGATKDLVSQGAPQDVAQKFLDSYETKDNQNYTLKGSTSNEAVQPSKPAQPSTPEKPIGDQALLDGIPAIPAPFKSEPTDSTTTAVAKVAGNLPTSLINAGTGVLNFLNPVKNVKDIVSHIGETYQQIQDYSKQTGENPFSILAKSLTSTTPTGKIDTATGKEGRSSDLATTILQAILPQFIQDIGKGDFQAATKHMVEQPAENIAPLILLGKGMAEKMGKGTEFDSAMSKVASPVTKGVPKVVSKVIPEGAPAPEKFQQATGQIFQPKNITETKVAQKVSANVDFSSLPKNPTYKDLSSLLQKNVDEKLGKVDEKLGTYQETFKPADLTKKVVGESGSTAKVNYVTEAIKGLKTLYKTVKDPQGLVDVKDLEAKFKNQGLSSKELNDLAKQYGTEIGKKAFDKMGNPLTNTGAQTYESIRTGVKEAARGTLPDEETKALDKNASSLIKAKDMADRMATKVDQLSNRIMKRNLGEKIGRTLGIATDFATLGTVKGFVAKLFPSNVGLKTMNSLDLESALGKNLKTIQKLTNAPDDVILKTIKSYADKINKLPNKVPAISATNESQQ